MLQPHEIKAVIERSAWFSSNGWRGPNGGA